MYGESMDKKKSIENMAYFYYEIYGIAINDPTVPRELQMELDMGAVDFVLDDDLASWVRTLNYIDKMNSKLLELAEAKPELLENCRILNRKLTMIIVGMKKVMRKDLNVSGFMRNNNKIEVVI